MINNNSSKLVAIVAATIVCGLLSTMTCTSGTYEILPVSDLQISQSDECIDLGDTRSYFPAQSKLNYAANSACTPGTLLCIRDRSNVRRWKPIDDMAPFAPADMGTEICNGIDDDCNGRIDDVPDLGASCSGGKGFCKSDGVLTCKPGNQFGCSAPTKSSINQQTYYAYPYLDGQGIPGWDWDCSGGPDILFCLQSGLTQGAITNPASSICNANLYAILNNTSPAAWDPTLCKSCTSGGGLIPQWGKSTVTITNSPTISDCGKSMPFVTCTNSGTGCFANNSDAVVVVCK